MFSFQAVHNCRPFCGTIEVEHLAWPLFPLLLILIALVVAVALCSLGLGTRLLRAALIHLVILVLHGHLLSISLCFLRGRGDFVRKNLVDLLLVLLAARVVISVLVSGTLLAEDLEAVDGRNVGQRALLRIQVWVSLEEDVGEAKPKVGTINVEVLLPRHIQLLASRTIGLFRVSKFDTYLDSGGG